MRQLSQSVSVACAASSTVTIDFKRADIKIESSEAYLLKLEKNLSKSFQVTDIFFNKNAVLIICRYIESLYLQGNK